jgi:hypothetical protein
MFRLKMTCLICFLLLVALPGSAQGDRGKSELSTPKGPMTVEYGKPQLKGRDPLSMQQDGQYWRMGSNAMTTLKTPVELTFGTTKVPAGNYGLWLLKNGKNYELVFNQVTEGMGMAHEKAKDVATVPMKQGSASAPVEALTLELKGAPGGGVFSVAWGTLALSAEFKLAK